MVLPLCSMNAVMGLQGCSSVGERGGPALRHFIHRQLPIQARMMSPPPPPPPGW